MSEHIQAGGACGRHGVYDGYVCPKCADEAPDPAESPQGAGIPTAPMSARKGAAEALIRDLRFLADALAASFTNREGQWSAAAIVTQAIDHIDSLADRLRDAEEALRLAEPFLCAGQRPGPWREADAWQAVRAALAASGEAQ